ncbi:hypothetical protein AX15_001786 [Amanita polypyramis BW_CC]|nr:hypothetical protein AX15_001786 [Amanita polypyramis BW_CC]
MSDTVDTDYEKLSKEEKEARDKADRAREAAEQAGRCYFVDLALDFTHHTLVQALPYSWIQELGEVDIVIPMAKGTRARDLAVIIDKKKLSVGVKGREPIMSGELCKEIKVEDSTWTLEDNQAVHIHLEKLNKQAWWENVLTHHPKINTQKIEPPTSKLSDLDGETRQVPVPAR